MIEELEAEAVLQMLAEERGGLRGRVTSDHQGAAIEIRARRRRDGASALCYSYAGVRLERSDLLFLVCPQTACDRSRCAKQLWRARDPANAGLNHAPIRRIPRSDFSEKASLFAEVPLNGGTCVARPATFAVTLACPANAHQPVLMQMKGWDVFKDGKYLEGGLSQAHGFSSPKFVDLESAVAWVNRLSS